MKPSRQFFKKLLYSSPLLAVILCFQNFDENSIVQQMEGIKVEEKTILLHSTTMSGAAEEIFLQQYAPEAKMFTEKLGEKVRFGFDQRQYDGASPAEQKEYLEPEMRVQVIGSAAAPDKSSINLVNVDRVRMKWADADLTCDYNPVRQTVQIRAPTGARSNLQIEHQGKTNSGRVSWQMSW